MKPIFITAASGNIGKHVVRLLRNANIPIRVASRADKKLIDEVSFDFSKPDTFKDAVTGCRCVFLVRPPAIANTKQTLNVFIDCAYHAGVEHIVFVSVAGAESNSIVPHHAVEQKLISNGQSYTILRPGFFAQNLEGPYLNDIKRDDRLYLPAGRGLVNFVDTRDIAHVAVMSLINNSHHSKKEYTLAGECAVGFDDVAHFLSVQLNRKISYVPATILGYMLHLYKQKIPIMQVLVQTVLHYGIRSGQAHIVDKTLSELLGRNPITMDKYIFDNKECWQK